MLDSHNMNIPISEYPIAGYKRRS